MKSDLHIRIDNIFFILVMAEQTEYNMVMLWLFICGFFRGL